MLQQLNSSGWDGWKRQGIRVRMDAPFATALHVVTKPCGGLRTCGDYRALNKITEPDRYAMPHLEDITHTFRGCRVFSLLDLEKAFLQVKMATILQHRIDTLRKKFLTEVRTHDL